MLTRRMLLLLLMLLMLSMPLLPLSVVLYLGRSSLGYLFLIISVLPHRWRD